MEAVVALKETGNELFKQSALPHTENFEQSLRVFREGVQSIAALARNEEVVKLHVILLINAALAANHLKRKETYQLSIELTTQALAIEPNNIKALYRRAIAQKELGEVLETQQGPHCAEVLPLYQAAAKDFEALHVLDGNNTLVKSGHADTSKNIFRVTTLQNKPVNYTIDRHETKDEPKGRAIVPSSSKKESSQKKQQTMEKIMEEYHISEVTAMAREKVVQGSLTEPLPTNKGDLERQLRELACSPEAMYRFIARMDEEYLRRMEPTFDTLFQLSQIVVSHGQGDSGRQIFEAIRGQRNFGLMWKSLISAEKRQFNAKFAELGLSPVE